MSTNSEYGYIRDSHYLVVKEDCSGRKESQALDGVFTEKANALLFMEEYVHSYIQKADGEEIATLVAYNPLEEANITYVCQHDFRHKDASVVTTSYSEGKIVVPEKSRTINKWSGVITPEVSIGTVKHVAARPRIMEKTLDRKSVV